MVMFKFLWKIQYSNFFLEEKKYRVCDFIQGFKHSHFCGCPVWDFNFFRTFLDIARFSGCPVSWDALYYKLYNLEQITTKFQRWQLYNCCTIVQLLGGTAKGQKWKNPNFQVTAWPTVTFGTHNSKEPMVHPQKQPLPPRHHLYAF